MMEVLVGYYIFINIVGFIIMKVDKQRAIEHRWRVPELHLWGIALLGGALGAWMGMQTYRHKTKRLLFRIGLPFLTFLHIGFWGYFLTG
ncbi:DUF1294 domain-containing protein [Bacillus sp. CHD6a]|uniref:DUF1294 domain-containing protein n=1 Tax=Bacillus sp. CHD6a TaxID=1643452 RepID=UPI0006CC4B0B|nr:DUF1294 domain-containing protein [Bacillus sp. CHD6a]KPB05459.1 membrane protein [Bacillus sp. CHD6a]